MQPYFAGRSRATVRVYRGVGDNERGSASVRNVVREVCTLVKSRDTPSEPRECMTGAANRVCGAWDISWKMEVFGDDGKAKDTEVEVSRWEATAARGLGLCLVRVHGTSGSVVLQSVCSCFQRGAPYQGGAAGASTSTSSRTGCCWRCQWQWGATGTGGMELRLPAQNA